MLQPIAEIRVPIVLDKKRYLVFNANTMAAFEQATGKFFLETVMELYKVVFPKGEAAGPVRDSLSILKKVSIVELRALIWASCHEYDKDDEAVWPLTLSQVGRALNLKDLATVFSAFLTGQSGNSPSNDEMGESPAEAKKSEAPESLPPNSDVTGGELGIRLPEDAFA